MISHKESLEYYWELQEAYEDEEIDDLQKSKVIKINKGKCKIEVFG